MSKKIHRITFTIALIIFIFCAIFLIKSLLPEGNHTAQYKNEPATTEISPPAATNDVTTIVLPDNPIDFSKLQSDNPDVYSWVEIPGTVIDYPVAQSDPYTDDLFYLDHNIEKKYEFAGTIFSQKQNKRDYTDPVTVLYGHNMLNGSMFAELHKFKDKNFFDKHDTIYIYTPGHILTYKIVSAYIYDDRHILNTFNFSDAEDFNEYISSVIEPRSMTRNVREGVSVTTNDRLLTLSTCTSNNSQRYLVQGVLINDELTK